MLSLKSYNLSRNFKAKYQQDWAFYGAMASSRFEDFISKD